MLHDYDVDDSENMGQSYGEIKARTTRYHKVRAISELCDHRSGRREKGKEIRFLPKRVH